MDKFIARSWLALVIVIAASVVPRPAQAQLVDLVKAVGPIAFKKYAPDIIDKLFKDDSDSAAKWKQTCGVDDPVAEINKKLNDVSKEIGSIGKIAKATHQNAVFAQYDSALTQARVLLRQMRDASGDQNRLNAAKALLSAKGALYWIRIMGQSLEGKQTQTGTSFFEQYSQILVAEKLDVYAYLAKMDALVTEYQALAIEAATLRKQAVELLPPGQSPKDVDNLQSSVHSLTQHERAITDRARSIANAIDNQGWEAKFRLRHVKSGNYLTTFMEGTPTGKYTLQQVQLNSNLTNLSISDVMNLSLYEKATGQPWSSWRMENNRVYVLSPTRQGWEIKKVEVDGKPCFRFRANVNGNYWLRDLRGGTPQLAGLTTVQEQAGCYDAVADPDGAWDKESGPAPLFLVDRASKKALDGNGNTSYGAGSLNLGNAYTRWQIVWNHL